MAKEAYYFSHDYGARNDPKLQKVLMKLGQEGKGVYWDLIEMLFEEGGKLLLSECDSYAFALRTNESCITKLINDFDLFCNDAIYFWSNSVNRRISERDSKSEKARQSVLKRWSNTNVLKNNTNEQKNDTIKERKGKERKIKEKVNSIVSDASHSDGIYPACMELYNNFIYSKTGVGAKIDGVSGKAMNKIVAYLKTQVKNKEQLQTEVPNALKYIFNHYEKWDSFHKSHLTLNQIESNLINIINSIKNGQSITNKQSQSQYAS